MIKSNFMPCGSTGAKGDNGITPHIGGNGNWYLGDKDTGVHATGARGQRGFRGEKGEKGDTYTAKKVSVIINVSNGLLTTSDVVGNCSVTFNTTNTAIKVTHDSMVGFMVNAGFYSEVGHANNVVIDSVNSTEVNVCVLSNSGQKLNLSEMGNLKLLIWRLDV